MISSGIRKTVCKTMYVLLCMLIVLPSMGLTRSQRLSAESSQASLDENMSFADNSYYYYYNANNGTDRSSDTVVVFDNTEVPARISSESNSAEWSFTIEKEACYAVKLNYCALKGNGGDISFSLALDNQSPFRECDGLTLPRIWKDEREADGSFSRDAQGNDLFPRQVEVEGDQEKWLFDVQGMYQEPYQFYLTAGKHTIKISYIDGDFLIKNLILSQPSDSITYKKYREEYSDKVSDSNIQPIKIEAALTSEKSDSGIYPVIDKSNASTLPNEPGVSRFNSIGGSNWCYTGDSISWSVDVPASGWYKIAIKARQNINQGMNSYRSIKIDGETPFEEAKLMCFPYNLKWKVYESGGDEAYLYYLSEGQHKLTLECVPGPLSGSLRELNQAVLDLNALYRDIIIVTGASPDIYQDYNLDTAIDDLVPNLKSLSKRLVSISEKIGQIVLTRDTQASILDEMALMLDKMAEKPFTIPSRLSDFKGDVEGIGSLLLSLTQQPLLIDYIEFVPENLKPDNGKAGFFKTMRYHMQSFVCSFAEDYYSGDMKDSDNSKTVNVWVSSGRDQIRIINQMVNDMFVKDTGIPIKLSLVDTSTTLIQATLTGKGPDVALMVPQDTPVNLASRGALVDLYQFDTEILTDEIYEQAFVPFQYNSGLYALPETQNFRMLFYRTDIFKELGIEVPNTWDEFYEVLNILQFNNLEVGIAEIDKSNAAISLAVSTFKTLLYQNGGKLFRDDLKATALDTEVAYKTFDTTTRLYTNYGLSREYDFFNRFRTGEMAMALENYSAYNQLTAAAPELNQLWSFAPIPATVREDGSLDRSDVSSVTGCIMLKSAVKKGVENEAWKFISWWVGSNAQSYYADLLESTMGILGRYTPANHVAFESMRWSKREKSVIMSQWETAICVPEIPGNYSIGRSLTSALRSSISNGASPRRELALYNLDINNEIERKRKEFGLS